MSKKEREYCVNLTARFRGCGTIVRASSLAEARAKALAGIFDNEVSTDGAEMVDWSLSSIEETTAAGIYHAEETDTDTISVTPRCTESNYQP